jgi:hypothetical protein
LVDENAVESGITVFYHSTIWWPLVGQDAPLEVSSENASIAPQPCGSPSDALRLVLDSLQALSIPVCAVKPWAGRFTPLEARAMLQAVAAQNSTLASPVTTGSSSSTTSPHSRPEYSVLLCVGCAVSPKLTALAAEYGVAVISVTRKGGGGGDVANVMASDGKGRGEAAEEKGNPTASAMNEAALRRETLQWATSFADDKDLTATDEGRVPEEKQGQQDGRGSDVRMDAARWLSAWSAAVADLVCHLLLHPGPVRGGKGKGKGTHSHSHSHIHLRALTAMSICGHSFCAFTHILSLVLIFAFWGTHTVTTIPTAARQHGPSYVPVGSGRMCVWHRPRVQDVDLLA